MLDSSKEFESAIAEASTQSLLVVDTEYEKCERYGEARIIGVSWGFPLGAEFHSFYAPFRHREYPTARNLDIELLQEFNRFPQKGLQVYHNFVADHGVFLRDGIDFSNRAIFDTMVATHLVDENERSYKLDDLARRKFKVRKKSLTDLEKLVGWEHIHPLVMGEYACQDVYLTYLLYRDAIAGLQHQQLESLYWKYEEFIKVLFKVINRGLHVDVDLARELQEQGRREMEHLTAKYNFNLGSAQQVARYLHDKLELPVSFKTEKGGPSTSNISLRRYRDRFPESSEFVEDVLTYRTTAKAVSTWYEGFVAKRGVDGLLHPGLSVVGGGTQSNAGSNEEGGTKTGRLTCREPNLQQVPRKGNAKRLFLHPPGKVLVEIDLSQAELRTTGYYMEAYGDDTIAKAYREGVDIHALTAENMGLTVTQSFADARQVAKTCNFSLCYRAGPPMLRHILYRDAGLDKTIDEARDLHHAWHQAFPLIKVLNEEAEKKARKRGFVHMWNGRRRHLQGEDCKKAYNSIIQGGVGQFMLEAMITIDKELPELEMVNQVHDSVWVYLPTDGWEEQAKVVADIMASIPTQELELPFAAEYKLIGQT